MRETAGQRHANYTLEGGRERRKLSQTRKLLYILGPHKKSSGSLFKHSSFKGFRHDRRSVEVECRAVAMFPCKATRNNHNTKRSGEDKMR